MINSIKVNFKKLSPEAFEPKYGTAFSAGADLYACTDLSMSLVPGETKTVPTGIAVEIPEGFVGLVFARSGLATKKGLAPANKVGVIDSDYRGEILVALHNHSSMPVEVQPGDRIAQLVIVPDYTATFTEKEELTESVRGAGGFGSTGK